MDNDSNIATHNNSFVTIIIASIINSNETSTVR